MVKSQFLFIRNGEIPVFVTRAEPPGGPGGRWKWERQSQALDLEKHTVLAGKIGDPILRVDTGILCD
jgi:hypothetical protein